MISRIIDFKGYSSFSAIFLSLWYVLLTIPIEIVLLTTLFIILMYRYKNKGVMELYMGFQYSAIYMVLLTMIFVIFWIINV
jgi:hypothetical protein